MTDIPKGYIKKKSVTVPFGYKLSTIQGYLEPISSQLEELNNNTSIPIFIAPKGNELYDKTYLASKNVKICLLGHHPFEASIQAVYDTLKSLKNGIPMTELNNIASRELIDKVTKKDEYEVLIRKYL